MNFKDIKFEIKEVSESGSFVGHAGVFNNVDLGKDLIQPGAFAKTINENPNVPILWVHQIPDVIGVNQQADEDKKGLHVEGQLILDVQRAREAHALMKAKAVKGLSIGYDVVTSDTKSRKSEGIRILQELKLWEYSVLPFPMNPQAQITSVKSAADFDVLLIEMIQAADVEYSFAKANPALGSYMTKDSELIERAIEKLSALRAAKAPEAAKHDNIAPELLHAKLDGISKFLRGEL